MMVDLHSTFAHINHVISDRKHEQLLRRIPRCSMQQLIVLLLLLQTLLIVPFIDGREVRNTPNNPRLTSVTTKGMVIDAGSGGSRLHVYSWQPRVFSSLPAPLSNPTSDESWTARITPGINSLPANETAIAAHLLPLMQFAKQTLHELKSTYGEFPIYFYATGGMRELPLQQREAIMDVVRLLLNDDDFCPFYFRDDFARIISGEEEAIFSWAAVNFLKGTLLPASQGLGIVTDVVDTYGTLDLGGASTQIAFFVPSQDISEGLYKLQIGSQKQWNVYAKSFLTFGVHSARRRHLLLLADAAVQQRQQQQQQQQQKKKRDDDDDDIEHVDVLMPTGNAALEERTKASQQQQQQQKHNTASIQSHAATAATAKTTAAEKQLTLIPSVTTNTAVTNNAVTNTAVTNTAVTNTAVTNTATTTVTNTATTTVTNTATTTAIATAVTPLATTTTQATTTAAATTTTHAVAAAVSKTLNVVDEPVASNYEGVLNYCFHAGYSEITTDSTGTATVELKGPQLPQADQLARCMDSIRPLMELQFDAFCRQIHHGDCSIAGSYQPPLPTGKHGNFIGTSTYALPWRFLMLPDTASLDLVAAKASAICQMNFNDILFYYETNRLAMGDADIGTSIPYFCFLTSYIIVLLQDGYNFAGNQTVTVIEQIDGNKVSWALGAILFEINELPWTLQLSAVQSHAWGFILLSGIIGCFIGGIAAVFVYREIAESRRVRISDQETFEYVKRPPHNNNSSNSSSDNNNNSGSSSNGGGSTSVAVSGSSGIGSSSGVFLRHAAVAPPSSGYYASSSNNTDVHNNRHSSSSSCTNSNSNGYYNVSQSSNSSPPRDMITSRKSNATTATTTAAAATLQQPESSSAMDWLGGLRDFKPFQRSNSNKYSQLPS